MKKGVLFSTNLILAFLLGATLSIAAEEKKAVVKSAVEKNAEVVPAKAPVVELLDINSASAVQIQKTLGISQESAKKIIAGRPYVKKDQLKSRKIFTQSQYYKIKNRIIARKPKVAAKAGKA